MASYEALIFTSSNFHKVFVLETDACVVGFGGVLSKKDRPLAYISKALKGYPFMKKKNTYIS